MAVRQFKNGISNRGDTISLSLQGDPEARALQVVATLAKQIAMSSGVNYPTREIEHKEEEMPLAETWNRPCRGAAGRVAFMILQYHVHQSGDTIGRLFQLTGKVIGRFHVGDCRSGAGANRISGPLDALLRYKVTVGIPFMAHPSIETPMRCGTGFIQLLHV